ncbi:hypothetical protein OZ410_12655, partial [Robiginitalea sp. M366]|uniref:beta strand repeat-containing protein n=1 Tax=Robiginitalea aestuariiviva TaxID=3036903 RepID=UPI00240D760F
NFDGTYTFNSFDGTPITLDTRAASNPYDNTASGLAATTVQAAIDEVAAGSTDDQNISGSGLAGTTLTIGIENGTSETVDLSSLVNDADADPTNEYNTGISFDGTNLTVTDAGGNQSVDISGVSTDDQTISTDGTAGNLSIESGNTITLNVDDADADPTNEFNTGVAINGGQVEVTDGGGTQSANLLSADANNDIAVGSDGALYLNVASVSVAETITNLSDNGDGTFTYVNESGVSQTVAKSDVTANGDGTYTFTNNDGSDVILDTRAASNPYDNVVSGLTATDVQAAIDEVAAGSTDDQNISGSGLAGTTLTIGIENGTSETVDLSSLVNDADADPTNEYNTGISFDGTNLTVTDAGGNQSVDISGVSTDDQTAAEVSIADAAANFTATDVEGALAELAAGSTDDQNISGSGLAGTTLTIGIENGTGETVDLSSLVNDADADPTNEYNTGISFDGTNLTVTDAGGNQSVDISGVSTDDQTAAEVSIA